MRRWTRGVNIFEKDFLLVPINRESVPHQSHRTAPPHISQAKYKCAHTHTRLRAHICTSVCVGEHWSHVSLHIYCDWPVCTGAMSHCMHVIGQSALELGHHLLPQ